MKLFTRIKNLFKKPKHKCKFKQTHKHKNYNTRITDYYYTCECGNDRKGYYKWR